MAEDPRNVGNAMMLVSVLATSSHVAYLGGRYESAIELARVSIAADARLPAEQRKGLIVRESVVGAKRVLGASACALPQAPPQARPLRIPLLEEARSLLVESRAFKRELVDRGIDARDATSAIHEIDADLKRCDDAIARLARG